MGARFIRVDVTSKDIGGGKRSDAMHCAVQRAIERTLPDATRVEVDTQTVRFTDAAGQRWAYLTPYEVAGYIIRFDAGEEIEPFSFRLMGDKRIPVHRRVRTQAGRVAERARSAAAAKVRREAAKTRADYAKAPRSKRVPRPPTSKEEQEAAQNAGRAAYAKAKAKVEGRVLSRRETEGLAQAPRRVFKLKHRHYGERRLRVNR